MGYEVDFLKVGEESNSGDAIPLRYGDLHGDRSSQYVVVIDAGFKETGPDVVKFVRKRYQTSVVDLAISTHPDGDHAAGLGIVLEELEVERPDILTCPDSFLTIFGPRFDVEA